MTLALAMCQTPGIAPSDDARVPVTTQPASRALPAFHVHEVLHLVKITGAPVKLTRLARLDLDTIQSRFAEGHLTVLASDDEVEAIRGLGLEATIEIEDLAAFYARRLRGEDGGSLEPDPWGPGSQGPGSQGRGSRGGPYGSWLSPQFGQGSMGGYYTYAEIGAVLDQMAAAYPTLLTPKVSIGTSIEGRSIWMVKASDNPGVDEAEPEMRIDAMHHAREPQGMQTTLYFLSYLLEEYGTDPLATYLLNEREIYVIPCVNPDGYEFNRSQAPGGGGLWRKNRRNNGGGVFGVDLNRNYPFQWSVSGSSNDTSSDVYHGPSAGSEPETMAMTQFIAGREFATALSVHTFSDLWLSPWGYVPQFPPAWPGMQEIGDLAAADNGYVHGPASIVLYEAAGVTVDYDYGVHDIYSWTPEIGSSADGFWPAQGRIVPLAEDNRLAFARTVLAAGSWLRPIQLNAVDDGDGDGQFEAGEDVEIEAFVRNSGRVDSGATPVSLMVASPFATVTDTNSIVTVPSFGTDRNTAPLRFIIDPAAPNGTVIPFTVTLVDGGRTVSLDGEITVGVRVVASFDFEAGGNDGWSIASPNNATTGNWVREDPNGTAAQPENDATPDPGTRCWFTGQGSIGGGLGANDVDGGSTTLLSPVFDLSGAQSATLSYSRWYSNDQGGAPNADVFLVELSDDGGATWANAETVGPSGPGTGGGWEEATLDVGQWVALTGSVRARFIASDLGSGSIVEAALDDVLVLALDMPTCPQPVNYCPLTPNQWTQGARISWSGSTDALANDLTLVVTDANPSGFGLFFYGQGRDQRPVGNGNFCVGSSFVRLPVVMTDAFGIGSYGVDFPSLPAPIVNGETWSFQYWMRDVGGAGYNFSDALEVGFCLP